MKPNYKRNDPRGWCGDPSRGAALGRPSVHSDKEGAKLYLRRIVLDSGGYDSNGTYFGTGNPLYWCTDGDEIDFVLRASDRNSAKANVLERYPKAIFFR